MSGLKPYAVRGSASSVMALDESVSLDDRIKWSFLVNHPSSRFRAMKVPSEKQAVSEVAERLATFLGQSPRISHQPDVDADALIDLGGTTFAVEWKGNSSLPLMALGAQQAARWAEELGSDVFPLVAVPFMAHSGRKFFEEAEIPWLDLSGNARIVIPGLRIQVEGRPNLYKRRGRPSSAFAPKSSRIARWLLMNPSQAMLQRDIARATDMDEGFTSRITARLEGDGLIVRQDDGAIRVRDPDLLLDAWREDYDFAKHEIVRGNVPARSGEELLRRLPDGLRRAGHEPAVTGLAAAWQMTRSAAFRLTTIYVHGPEVLEALEELGFREEERGANVWAVIPNDEGVFQGGEEIDGIPCVHPVQAYLDLHHHPERAAEAAENLRLERLRWK